MAYIRERSEERTGYQSSCFLNEKIDFQCDFVMAYRINDTTEQRVKEFRSNGYEVHLMTGIAWGGYTDYLEGRYDGRDHHDEGQTDRFGNVISHGVNSPYYVPTVSFADYIAEQLKKAVDAGVSAIHVEEPEFWDRAGYSPAFKREYLLYYREPWQPPHESADSRYKAAKLKAFLYRRAIERVSASIKEYALIKYNRVVRFYVPTHSLLNYTQWKIMSPEGSLADVAALDGFIAQVWTGTSREKNFYNSVFKERTFETAYLEYGVMQELVKGTGKKMWFLHDPIEDNPAFDWADYKYNYLKTVTASLLHTKINTYEICPWPNRVFAGAYPKDSPLAQTIPPEYATLLNGVFQTLGDMECCETVNTPRTGVLISDTALYQRGYPDCLLSEAPCENVGTVLNDDAGRIERMCRELPGGSDELLKEAITSNALPSFYGLCLPLLKCGLPVRPVLLDNLRRYAGYLDDYDVLILSYEFMKPEFPDINNALAAWVKNGGRLIYVGDGSDPYHAIKSWWSGKYLNPAQHLFEMLSISPEGEKSFFDAGKGKVAVWNENPALICFSAEKANELRQLFKQITAPLEWKPANYITEKRPPYIVSAVLDESPSDEPLVFKGLFADMYTPDFSVITEKTVHPDENSLLFDFSQIEGESLRVIGTCARVTALSQAEDSVSLEAQGSGGIKAYIRLRVPFKTETVSAALPGGESLPADIEYDELSKTALLSFNSVSGKISFCLSK